MRTLLLSPVHAVPVRATEPTRSKVWMHLARRGRALQVIWQEALQSDAAWLCQGDVQTTTRHDISGLLMQQEFRRPGKGFLHGL